MVSTKKDDLAKILQGLNVQTENPCCVLTQEMAKKFVFDKDSDKYGFFLNATGLSKLKDEMVAIETKIEETRDFTKRHEQMLEPRRETARNLHQQLAKLQEVENIAVDIKACDIKVQWVNYHKYSVKVNNIERELRKAEEDASKAEQKLSLESTKTSSNEERIVELNEQLEILQNDELSLYRELTDVKKEINTAKDNIEKHNRLLGQLNSAFNDQTRRKDKKIQEVSLNL